MNHYENQQILGNWKIHRLLGAGSYGKVYEIRQNGGEFRAALKIISIPSSEGAYRSVCSELGSEGAAQQYFTELKDKLLNEIKFLYRLQGNTNIVNYQNHAIVEHTRCFGWDILIQMELLYSLTAYYGKKKQITLQDIIRLGMDICKALERCQKYNIVHRDIKPDNIMVSDTGDYKLGDFGVSCVLREDQTRRMSRRGTEYYMAPELLKMGTRSDSRVDIYSLGIVMYKLLNANRYPLLPPYPQKYDLIADENDAFIRRIQGEQLPPPLYAAHTRLGEIVLKACEADPQKRYFSPREMYEDLASIRMYRGEETIFQIISDGAQITYRPTMPMSRKEKPSTRSAVHTQQGKNRHSMPARRKGKFQSSQPEAHRKTGKKWIFGTAAAALILVPVFLLTFQKDSGEPLQTEAPAIERETEPTALKTTVVPETPETTSPAESDILATMSGAPVFAKWNILKLGELAGESLSGYTAAPDFLAVETKGGYVLADPLGNPVTEDPLCVIEKLQDGCYAITLKGEEVNRTGAVKADGTPVLDCQYLSVETISERFLWVSTATEETDDLEKAAMYWDNSPLGTYDLLYHQKGHGNAGQEFLTPPEDAILYKGYHRIFDLKEERFVPGIKIANGKNRAYAFSSTICLDTGSSFTFYDAEGTELDTVEEIAPITGEDSVLLGGSNWGIYGDHLKLQYEAPFIQTVIQRDPGGMQTPTLYEIRENGKYYLIDSFGKRLTAKEFDSIEWLCGGTVVVQEDGKYGIYDVSGKEIYPATLDNYLSAAPLGFYMTDLDDGRKLLIDRDGFSKEVSSRSFDLLDYEEEGGKYFIYPIRQEESICSRGYPFLLTPGLVSAQTKNGRQWGVYDTVNGTELLPCQYDKIQYANGCLYGEKLTDSGSVCDVFSVNPVYLAGTP